MSKLLHIVGDFLSHLENVLNAIVRHTKACSSESVAQVL